MFDMSTLNVFIVIVLFVCAWVFVVWSNSRTMKKQILQVAQQQSVIRHDDNVRLLCRAIHYLYPTVHAGTDYIISEGDSGGEPYISQWFHTGIPKPGDDEIRNAMNAVAGIDPVKDHAAQRLREYPSIGDQLDAAYKARHGDSSEQTRLDEQITMIKARYPKSDKCL